MIDVVGIVVPVVKGVLFLVVILTVLYGIWKFLQMLGIEKLWRKKPSPKMYEELAEKLSDGKSAGDIAIYIHKKPQSLQRRYWEAYFELIR